MEYINSYPSTRDINSILSWLNKRCEFNTNIYELDKYMSPLKEFIFDCYKKVENIGISKEALNNRCTLLNNFIKEKYFSCIKLDCYYGANLLLWLLTGEYPAIVEANMELELPGCRLLSAHEDIKLISPLQFKEDKYSHILRQTFQEDMSIWLLDIGGNLVGMSSDNKYVIMTSEKWYEYVLNKYKTVIALMSFEMVMRFKLYLNYRNNSFYRNEKNICLEFIYTSKNGDIKNWKVDAEDLAIK